MLFKILGCFLVFSCFCSSASSVSAQSIHEKAKTIVNMDKTHTQIIVLNESVNNQLAELYQKFDTMAAIFANINCAEKKMAIQSLKFEILEYSGKSVGGSDGDTLGDLEEIRDKISAQYQNECEGENK